MKTMALALILATASGGIVHAACSDEIASLTKTLDALGREAGAATSAGQATGAQRSETAIEARSTDTPVKDLPKPPTSDNMAATQAAAKAGGAGDKVMQAKVSLNAANEAMKRGDEPACLAAIAKAKSQMAN